MRMLVPSTTVTRSLLAVTLLGSTILTAEAVELPDFAALVRQQGSAVVSIDVDRQVNVNQNLPAFPPGSPFDEFFKRFEIPQNRHALSQGSGFILSADGYILTNHHVIEDANEITVGLADRRELKAKLIGSDERTDVALLKVDASDLPSVKIGDSDQLQVGEWVLAIGSPFGLERSATQGIVSALSRNLPKDNYVPFIQTDAAVNPGNSGGPLFNTKGEVVGINSQIYSRSGGYMGVSFAIPINVAMQVSEQLKTNGKVSRGWLGVTIQELDQALAESFGLSKPEGALVAQVDADGPAHAAGLKSGDVILRYDGKPVERSGQLPMLVAATASGKSVVIEVLRDGKRQTVTVEVGQLAEKSSGKSGTAAGVNKGRLGLAAQELTAPQRKQLGLGDRGVQVVNVIPGSPADAAGIQTGDIVLSFDRQDISTPEQLIERVKAVPAGRTVIVLVQRDGSTRFVTVKFKE